MLLGLALVAILCQQLVPCGQQTAPCWNQSVTVAYKACTWWGCARVCVSRGRATCQAASEHCSFSYVDWDMQQLPFSSNSSFLLHPVTCHTCCPAGATCASGENNTFDEDTCLVLPEWAIRSGPRETIYFDPEKV